MLTDADVFAILCRDGMGGFGGLTLEQYDSTPDEVIRDSYFAERDEDHNLVTLRQRRRMRQGGTTGRPEFAGRELPSRKTLRIPAEAWNVNGMLSMTPFGQGWVLMFWQVWRRRQQEGMLTEAGEPISDAYILERFRKAASKKDGRPQRQLQAEHQHGGAQAAPGRTTRSRRRR